ncbi:MAG TPA: PQQ-binding-like beta-propeller repeat protein, partial [Symbiobacteriaceae bacterium]|nr:PQQ-binding-like beta-propeller repeat protein [Symbiobacteriaceae bacterium]
RSPTRGRGIAFLHGGGVVVAGNTAFDRSGGNLWPVPLEPAGLAAAGDDALVAWDGHQVVLQEARSGQLLLRADLNVPGASITRVVPSPDGRLLAVVGSNPDGDSVVWVMDRSGRILWTERFRETPTGMAFAGDQLVIMLPHKVKFRTIPQ